MPQKQFYDYNSRGPVESFTTAHESLYSRTTHASHLASPFFLSGSDVQLGAIKMANRPRWAGLFVFFPLFLLEGGRENHHPPATTHLKPPTTMPCQAFEMIYAMSSKRWKLYIFIF